MPKWWVYGFESHKGATKNKTMEQFKIDSYELNEHKNELVLYVGEAVFCTVCCSDTSNQITDEEIEDVILDIEFEENRYRSKSWAEYLAK